jgi:hypothetical protein
MLNERFDAFSHSVDNADNEPTKPQLDVFAMLSKELDEQVKNWTNIKTTDVPKVSDMIKQANLPALIITEKK